MYYNYYLFRIFVGFYKSQSDQTCGCNRHFATLVSDKQTTQWVFAASSLR